MTTRAQRWTMGISFFLVMVVIPTAKNMNAAPPVYHDPLGDRGSCVAAYNYDGKVPADMPAECDAQYRKAMTDYGLGDYIQK